MKEINFNISRGNIVLQAKDETYLSARSVLAVEVSNQNGRYEMQADERATHERKLLNSISSAVYGLKAELNEYIVNGDIDESKDEIQIVINIYDAFRSERLGAIKELFSNYIAKRVISEWWKANYPNMSSQYDELALQALEELKRAFYFKGEAEFKTFNK